ncbi:hypothetical protein [Bradyrhizobium prioriisuperbiae]|uniref:hypothetical protein n=1 Tax=Bradyrhizobium prioriisuperbiae TaxID=2854389 RepID=UPI0028E88F13|nr:hypothetical protein [Bradyrhizobium prioritasuperba]
MGTDFNIKPVGGPVAAPIVRPLPDAARNAVETDLPPPKTTTAADAAANVRNNPQPDASNLTDQVVIDRAAASIVYRVVDNRTSLVVRQFPDEARLRLRTYLRAQDEVKREQAEQARYDRTA